MKIYYRDKFQVVFLLYDDCMILIFQLTIITLYIQTPVGITFMI